ncbi:MAG: hypothetical protein IJ713_03915 [Oscillibacter sp.]|nr:hypothetical protein [Oscillibacter sp.]
MGAFFTFLFLVILYGIYHATIKRGMREQKEERSDRHISMRRMWILSWFYFQEVMEEVYACLTAKGFSGETPYTDRFMAMGEMMYGRRPAQEAVRRAVVLMQSKGWDVMIHDDVNDIMKENDVKVKIAPINMPAEECAAHITYHSIPDKMPKSAAKGGYEITDCGSPYGSDKLVMFANEERIAKESLRGIIVHNEDVTELKDLDPRTRMFQQQGTGKWCAFSPIFQFGAEYDPLNYQYMIDLLRINHIDQKYPLDRYGEELSPASLARLVPEEKYKELGLMDN